MTNMARVGARMLCYRLNGFFGIGNSYTEVCKQRRLSDSIIEEAAQRHASGWQR
jgi:hypothetical protein